MVTLRTENHICNILFALLCSFAVILPWLFPNFLTADGPCHVYNASVLQHFMNGDSSFYNNFYYLNTELEPNWLSHALLAGLMYLFEPFTAEKVVMSLCILLLAVGYRYFILGFAAKPYYLTLWVIPFLWQMAMFMGFYNYMLSIGFMFLVSGYWLRHRGDISWGKVVLLSLLMVVLYFMHLLGIFLGMAIMGLVSLFDMFRRDQLRSGLMQAAKLACIFLPALLLALNYVVHNSGSFSNEYKPSYADLWNNLHTLFSLQSITPFEFTLAKIVARSLFILLLAGLIMLVRYRNSKEWLMPMVMLIVLLLCYFFVYERMLGGSYIRYRLEGLICLMVVTLVAAVPMLRAVRLLSVVLAVVVSVTYFAVRVPMFRHINEFVGEMKSLEPRLRNESVILPLKYDLFPKNRNGQTMANKVLLFSHVAETAYRKNKKLIFLENYEADTYYFPLIWKRNVNPFDHLSTGNSIEGVPPEARLAKYNRDKVRVDHIIIYARQGEILKDPKTIAMMDTINHYYDLVYTTPVYNIELYNLKELK